VPFFFGHFVVAVLLPADVHLRVREPGVGVHLERRERVGNRRGGDVRGLGVCFSSASSGFRDVWLLRQESNVDTGNQCLK
jgi:hypothetical protein